MRMLKYVLVASVCSGFLLCLGSPSMAQQPVARDKALEAAMRAQQEPSQPFATDFGGNCAGADNHAPPCDESTRSLGKFRIYIAPPYRALFAGYPGYQNTSCLTGNTQTAFRLESPCLFDSLTKIGRSASHTQGNAADTGGTLVGHHPGTLVSDSDFTLMPSLFDGPSSLRKEIHTQIVTLDLEDASHTVHVHAGTEAPAQPKSFGEVQSKGPALPDLPADSFFDVFVEVDLPAFGAFPGGTVYNTQALLIQNNNVSSLPPTVVYVHGNSSMVPVYVKAPAAPPLVAGSLLGWLTLAGHGVGTDSCQEGSTLESVYCDPAQAKEMIGKGGCCLPDGTCEMLDLQGCNDAWLPIVDNGEHYAGDGNPCMKCGACCQPANVCNVKWEFKCHELTDGHFEGSSTTSCTHNPNGSCKLGACCRPDNVCTLDTTSDECAKLGGRYEGDSSTTCAHNAAGDCIPTLSEWGVVVMAMLVLTAGTIVVMRRRAAVV